MRRPRLPTDEALEPGSRVALSADTVHHLRRVLRLPDGAPVQLFNGDPGDWDGRLVVTGKNAAMAEVDSFCPRRAESSLALSLIQGVSRGQRMDYTLEKSVELGVQHIQPVVMARSVAAPKGERIAKKMAHWRGVVESAAAQSGRTQLPTVAELIALDQVLPQARAGEQLVLLDPEATVGARDLRMPSGSLTLIAGPEGGLTPAERAAASRTGAQAIRLGPRVLRTETAAVAALALLQGLYGDL